MLGVCKIGIDELIRTGTLRPRQTHLGLWGWTDHHTGQHVDFLAISSIETKSKRLAEVGLGHRITIRSVSDYVKYRVRLVAIPRPFGGVRWRFLCR